MRPSCFRKVRSLAVISDRAGVQKCSNFAKFLQLSEGARQFLAFVLYAELDAQQSFQTIHIHPAAQEMHGASNRRLDRGSLSPRETPACVPAPRASRPASLLCRQSNSDREGWGTFCG